MGVKFSLNLRVTETRLTKALSVVNSGSVEHLQKKVKCGISKVLLIWPWPMVAF